MFYSKHSSGPTVLSINHINQDWKEFRNILATAWKVV